MAWNLCGLPGGPGGLCGVATAARALAGTPLVLLGARVLPSRSSRPAAATRVSRRARRPQPHPVAAEEPQPACAAVCSAAGPPCDTGLGQFPTALTSSICSRRSPATTPAGDRSQVAPLARSAQVVFDRAGGGPAALFVLREGSAQVHAAAARCGHTLHRSAAERIRVSACPSPGQGKACFHFIPRYTLLTTLSAAQCFTELPTNVGGTECGGVVKVVAQV